MGKRRMSANYERVPVHRFSKVGTAARYYSTKSSITRCRYFCP